MTMTISRAAMDALQKTLDEGTSIQKIWSILDSCTVVEPPAASAEAQGEFKGWYCAHCECGVDGRNVTFSEQHDACGRYIANDRPPKALSSTPALREVTDEDVRAARHAYNSAVILNGSDAREWIRAALESFRARLSAAQGVEARLWDSQWLNIVNHADCWKDYSKERAVNDAVEMTEKAMAKNIRDGFPPAKSAPEAP